MYLNGAEITVVSVARARRVRTTGASNGGRGGWADNGGYANDVGLDDGRANGNESRTNGNGNAAPKRGGDIFDHEF